MRAIWLHQPYPTLIEIGVKGWETRGQPPNGPMRPAGVRGMPGLPIEPGERIAIVAAMREPKMSQHDAESDDGSGWWIGDTEFRVADERPEDEAWWLERWHQLTIDMSMWPLPLGVVVCTAVAAEVLPIIGDDDMRPEGPGYIVNDGYRLTVHSIAQGRDGDGEWVSEDISGQLPYGDWRPGRWAWRLTDVESVPSRPEPVVVRGNRQGVCEIEVTW